MFGKHFWAALAIIAMWVAVLVVGIAGGGEFIVDSGGANVRIPAVWGVGLFALIGSVTVGAAAFRDAEVPRREEVPPPPSG